jgi:hypothetical protein
MAFGPNKFQGKPNKTKENCLDFVGFLWPIRGFSMGYEGKNKKNFLPVTLCLNGHIRICPNASRASQPF